MTKYYTNLKNVWIGDKIIIGYEGIKFKYQSVVSKITPTNRVVLKNGDIFNRDVSIFRKNSYYAKITKGKVYAAPISQRFLDEEYKSIKTDFLKNYDWDSEDISLIEDIIK